MTRRFVWVSVALMLGMLAGAGRAEQDGGIPPMLETQRPLAQPSSQEKSPSPPEAHLKPASRTDQQSPAAKGKGKKGKTRQAAVTGPKKTQKPVKKKGVTAKPRGKSANQRS
ncbi:MAG: hypothetical protein ACUVXF_07760 [Desulfobaccales bacterium]